MFYISYQLVPLTPGNSSTLQSWWCGYKGMRWRQSWERSPCNHHWTSHQYDYPYNIIHRHTNINNDKVVRENKCLLFYTVFKMSSSNIKISPKTVSQVYMAAQLVKLTSCWNSKRHKQDWYAANVSPTETQTPVCTCISAYFVIWDKMQRLKTHLFKMADPL